MDLFYLDCTNEFGNYENRLRRGTEKTWLIKDNDIQQLVHVYRNIINIRKQFIVFKKYV